MTCAICPNYWECELRSKSDDDWGVENETPQFGYVPKLLAENKLLFADIYCAWHHGR